jgi:hypothetical protein
MKGTGLANRRKKESFHDHRGFITFMQLAREDPEIRKRMKMLLSLDPFNRKSMLNTWLRDLRLRGAPKEYVEALSFFLDDKVAEKALQLILESDGGTS